MTLFGLFSRFEDWVLPDNGWRRVVAGTLFCRMCGRLLRSVYPRTIDVKLIQIRSGTSVDSVSGAVIGVIHRRLLERLAEHLSGFALGQVYDETNTSLEDYRTFYSAHIIRPRGSAQSGLEQCPICGTILYIAKGTPYILRHQVGSQHVYHDGICSTYIDEWLASQINWKEFKDLRLHPFPVKDHPEDGWRLPGDPDWMAMGIPCKEWQSNVLALPSPKNERTGSHPVQNGLVPSGMPKGIMPPPAMAGSISFKYFASSLSDMAGFVGEIKTCSLCGQQGPCFELEHAICPELPQGKREGKTGCYDCLRTGRFEFWHYTERGSLHKQGLRSELTNRLYLPEGFAEESLIELRRTPRIACNQKERWLVHCYDFMVYQGVWSPPDFYEHDPDGDGRALFMNMTDADNQSLWDDSWYDRTERLSDWHATYYVFRCLYCGKLRGNWDID